MKNVSHLVRKGSAIFPAFKSSSVPFFHCDIADTSCICLSVPRSEIVPNSSTRGDSTICYGIHFHRFAIAKYVNHYQPVITSLVYDTPIIILRYLWLEFWSLNRGQMVTHEYFIYFGKPGTECPTWNHYIDFIFLHDFEFVDVSITDPYIYM